MTTFNDREKSFEKKFQHDQEVQFKVNARKNKLLGLWAAGLLGKAVHSDPAIAPAAKAPPCGGEQAFVCIRSRSPGAGHVVIPHKNSDRYFSP